MHQTFIDKYEAIYEYSTIYNQGLRIECSVV